MGNSGRGRKNESEVALPEVSAVFDQLSELFEDVSKKYRGVAL